MQGVPSPVAIGFLLAAPTINPIVFWATWTAFRDQPEIVFMRVGFSLAIATIIGWVFSVQRDLRPFLQPVVARAISVRREEREMGRGEDRATRSSSLILILHPSYNLVPTGWGNLVNQNE